MASHPRVAIDGPDSRVDGPIIAARLLNAFGILGIAAVLGASLYYQFVLDDAPCKLCLLQRVCMVGVALGAAMNIALGMRVRHYAIAVMFSVSGALAAGRHILINACPLPGEPSGYGPDLFGFHTYTWAFAVFGTAIFASAIMLMWSDGLNEEDSGSFGQKHWTKPIGICVVGLISLICVVMTISAIEIAATYPG
ncbi:MAG: disulfide bond formation protein B [Mycolicibacterium sp.]|uniref:disulfide bond formation protein B n=1 Tax=Mycolicibacterium sp. TaxID=2320850 RepID=UPI003D1245AE